MADELSGALPAGPRWTRADVLVALVVLTASAALVWPELMLGWYPWDDGAMAQVAERVMHGQVPHRDFDDPWTGGWSLFQAVVFQLFGTSLRMIRVPIFAAWMLSLVVGFRVLRRYVAPIPAGAATLGWAVWTLYAWHYPLLNWYYAPLALCSVWGIIRFHETAQRRFLVAAGAAAGVAIAFKVSGFFLLAALLLWTVAYAAEPTYATEGQPTRATSEGWRRLLAAPASAGFAVVVATAGGLFCAMVVRLLLGLPASVQGSALGLFAAPIIAVVLLLTWCAWRSRRPAVDAIVRLLRVGLPLLLGVGLIVGPLIAYFATHGALRDMISGVLVRPAARLTLIWTAPPGRVATAGMLLAPLALLVGLLRVHTGSARRDAVTAALLGAGVGALALLDTFTVGTAGLLVRSLPVMLPLAAIALRADRELGQRSRPPYGAVTMLLVALAVCSQLLQVPWASLSYALYATPLAILAFVALAVEANAAASAVAVFAGAFLAVSGYGHHATNADKPPPARYAPLPLPRAGIRVSPDDSALFAETAALVGQRPGAIHVLGDAPEYVFLLERPTPSRAIYDVLADSAERDPARALPMLDRAGVRTVLLLNQFGLNDSTTVRQQRALEAAYPYARALGRRVWDGKRLRRFLEVRWRRDSASAP